MAHKREDFTCGKDRIDSYFREAVSQDVKRKYATCFAARDIATNRVAGFYTLYPLLQLGALERGSRAAGEDAAPLPNRSSGAHWQAWTA